MKEEKLYDKVKDILLLKTTDGVYETVAEYLEKNKEKHENVIYFATDTNQQAQYIRLFKEQGLEAAIISIIRLDSSESRIIAETFSAFSASSFTFSFSFATAARNSSCI